jgi:hypothetical protein
MDKWDESVNRIKNSMLAEEPDAALAAGLQLFAEFGRTLDRIATALEGGYKPMPGDDDVAPVHDL